MKVKLHGIQDLTTVVEKVPTEKVNVANLITTFEANLDKSMPMDWLIRYGKISKIYKVLFTQGELPKSMLDEYSGEILEIAYEHINEDLQDVMDKASSSSGRDYYYEFGRSLGVEQQASVLKEFIDEESDFI